MKPEEIIRGLRYEQKKRENDFVGTCQTNISAMCGDAADCIESLQTQLTAYGNRYPITIDKETQCIVDKKAFDMCMEDNIRLQAQLAESQRREQAAVDMLRTIDWVGSGAKGRIEDAIGILSGPARLVKEDRKVTLLRAARNLLKKQQDTPYILNLLDETVFYDDTYCDGMCLLCDINIELKEVTNGD